MQEWDGISAEHTRGVIVIGATNRPFDLDEAVLRRLPRRLMISLPDPQDRLEILTLLLKEEVLDSANLILPAIVERTSGFSGSDLKNLCIAAALQSMKRVGMEVNSPRILTLDDFCDVLDAGQVVPGLNERAELMRQLVEWDKIYGTRSGGYNRGTNTGFGFNLVV
jgi:SpoVK/Ycf46/Vps4 family AAA+-type ATPase